MKIKFILPLYPEYVQNMSITGSVPELGNFDISKSLHLSFEEGVWNTHVNFLNKISFEYSYIIKDDVSGIICESGPPRKFIAGKFDELIIFDEWKPFIDESPFLSNAFKKVFFKRKFCQQDKGNFKITCSANNLSSDEFLLISGNANVLGNWELSSAVPMNINKEGIWEINFDRYSLPENLEYKFIVLKINNREKTFMWEDGGNRIFNNIYNESFIKIVVNHFSLNRKSFRPKFAGTAIPVFSLKSDQSCGIGEFNDLKEMIDLLHITGQKVLQVLPVNDTTMSRTWEDSYPYGAISGYALHPLYVNLEGLGKINNKDFLKKHNILAEKLNALDNIDYEAVSKLKWAYIRKIFNETGDNTLSSDDYKFFFIKNAEWLVPYSAFCYFRDKYKTAAFSKWPEHSIYVEKEIAAIASPKSKYFNKISLYYFIQYHLHLQLSEVHSYANRKGVVLKGDIPIGINRNSVEVWLEPHYFNLNVQAGAPPDDFSIKGQNWGFPTYNWNEMEKDGFIWWKKRLRKMSEYFDSYRIDHILGFFRIWEIPKYSSEGLMGYFNPSFPLSEKEINSFGYRFDSVRDCVPHIKGSFLNNYFGANKDKIVEIFFDNIERDLYRFKDNFSTQISIVEYFSDNYESKLSEHKETLLSLYTEVLFISDPIDQSKFHPGISAQNTKSFQLLSQEQQDSFNRIYYHYYYERNTGLWYNTAMRKLPSLISSTGMLVCGEDLGMIPACVPSVMKSLSILTLEIQRMPKAQNTKFGNPAEYPYLSVCTTGTHDTSTLRGWWEENRNENTIYYREIIGETGDAPYYCEPWLCRKIIDMHLNSSSMLVILPLQDWLAMFDNIRRENPTDERINVPSNPKHYWKYRMHLKTNELITNKELTNTIKKQIEMSGRL